MANYKPYLMRPIQHMLDASQTSLHQGVGYAGWGTQNLQLFQKSMKKRQGYVEDRDLGQYVNVQQILTHQTKPGVRSTVFLTDTDFIKRETASNETWSYRTEKYNTGKVTNITTATVTGDGDCVWNTAGLAAGDKFILTTDYTAAKEPNNDWATILTAAATEIVLTTSYSGTTGDMTGDYLIRKVYSTPTNERWQYATVDGKLCFTNGSTNVQYWAGGATYAADLNATYATRARYCIEYANRLILGDLWFPYGAAVRHPLTIRCSKEGVINVEDADWTDSTAADYDLLQTDDFLKGFGKVGASLIVYKSDSIIIGNATGEATNPLVFPRTIPGIGCIAPHSIVPIRGTNAFLGREDFYIIDGDTPISIGEKIRSEFFNLVNNTEAQYTFGYANVLQNEVRWFATSKDGERLVFVWNFKTNEWYYYKYYDDMFCGGRGLLTEDT